jgi:hypothetical protein
MTPGAPTQPDISAINTQISGIQGNLAEMQAQQKAMTQYGVKDTSDLVKDASGNYVPKSPIAPNVPTPAVTPETQAIIDKTEKDYQESLKLSPEELSTQEDIDDLIASTQEGYRKTKGQPIAMDFITGQLKAIEERALGMAEPLERKLARLESQRLATQDASKFALDRADKKAETERSSAEKASDIAREEKKTAFEQEMAKEDLQLSKEGLSEEKRRTDLDYKLSTEKFEEDKRQFGMEYALREKELAQKQQEAVQADDKDAEEALTNLSLVNEIIPNASKISGIIQTGIVPFTEGAGTVAKYDQLKSILQLAIRGELKGQGTVSDFEGKVLAKAATSINRAKMSEGDFKQSLLDIRGVFSTMAGVDASVTVVNPQTGETDNGFLSREGINDARKQGLTVIYR